MKIIHLGGEHTVTGSCHLLQGNGLNIMVDCGLVQGDDSVMPRERVQQRDNLYPCY
jgi:metallo-beta-lactamase family protein